MRAWSKTYSKSLACEFQEEHKSFYENFSFCIKDNQGKTYFLFFGTGSVQGTNNIKIPLDRQQLADYLGVERTALSKELGKMRDDGLLTFHKNEFHVVTGEGK